MALMRLITIPMSHYCEKARWGLERLGIPYREERHLQVFHYLHTFRYSHGPQVPVLIDGAQVIADSTSILKHLDSHAAPAMRLYPDNPEERYRVEELENLFDEVLGVESRRWIYFHYLPHTRDALRFAGEGVPVLERFLAPACYPFMKSFMRRRLRVYEPEVVAGLMRTREIIRNIDELLSDKREYLVGGRFSAADLTLACMMAPFVLPRQYGIRLPAIDDTPLTMRETVREFRDTPTGKFVLRLFETKRHQVLAEPGLYQVTAV